MRLLFTIFLLIIGHSAVAAQGLADMEKIPNLSGVWVLDPGKGGPIIASIMPVRESNKAISAMSVTMTIEHSEPFIRVKSLVEIPGEKTVQTNSLFFSNGRRVEAFGKLDSDNFRTAVWHGRKLVEEIHALLEKGQTKGMDKIFKGKDTYRLKTVRTYELSKDEKTLTVTESGINGGSLPIKIQYKRVFRRQT